MSQAPIAPVVVGGAAEAVDVSDTGAVIGHVTGPDGDLDVGYVWSAPDDEGAPLPDPSGQASVLSANDISANGTWVAGGYRGNKAAAAVRWNLETGETQEEPSADEYAAVNDDGDAVTEGVEEPYTSSVIVQADGTEVHLASDDGRYELAEVLPERDAEATAAGYSDFTGPAVYRGC